MNTNIIPHDASLHSITEASREAAQQVTGAVKEACNTVSTRVEDTVLRTKGYVRQNPMPVILGSLVLGVAIGCLVAVSRRAVPTLKERFMQDPVHAARDMLYAALEPAGRRLHEGYDSASEGAERAYENVRGHFPSLRRDSWGRQLARNLKFW
jgi:ElaB/YqjD/DUF883 family membrane-anchored ribosome-binding protein